MFQIKTLWQKALKENLSHMSCNITLEAVIQRERETKQIELKWSLEPLQHLMPLQSISQHDPVVKNDLQGKKAFSTFYLYLQSEGN